MAHLQPYPWHDGGWRRLTGLHAEQRLPHALILSGPAGVGKHAFAESLASLLMCVSPRQGLPCGECKGCSLCRADTHPDYCQLSPVTDEKTGKTSKVIKVDQIRALLDFLSKSPQLGGWRIAIIDPADTLNVSAANSLLKTLEEPGDRTLLLLLTDQPLALLPTIRSRCQHFDLGVPDRAQAQSWLSPQLETPTHAGLLLSLCHGAPLAALAMSQQEVFRQREDLAKRLLAVASGRVGPLSASTATQKLPADEAWLWFYGLLADVGLMAAEARDAIKNRDLLPIIGSLAEVMGSRKALDLQALCLDNRRLLAANIQPGLLWDRFWEQTRG
ncbi:DNA polymerase-3 subunit delta' [Fluviicoccus keumensis]|uniref:DNA polymerase III subunit delta' n=1 Tax=Fluviicoccus keumensis TaxID=1435465 RepID=A0A4Q7YKU0_9GAMM|nr:DNA polymerase III subunit delta' [Fluviicoccus keumensis]RZU37135.1 DNA polymerase-3 subunit delta' [Fluviicoccus keumensis]